MEPITLVLPHPRSAAPSTAPVTPRSPAASRTPGRTLSLAVSLTAGAEAPLRALAEAPESAHIVCHPHDEAIVAHLLAHVRRDDCALLPTVATPHGQLTIRVRLAIAS